MSNQLSSGQGRDINVFAGQSLAVSSITGAYTATIIAGAGLGTVLATASTGGATYGPYAGGVTIRLIAGEGGLIDYEAAVSPVLNYAGPARLGYSAAGDSASVVDPAGIPVGQGNVMQGFSGAVTIPEVIYDQSKGGKYVFTQYDGTYGKYVQQLSIATGPLTSLTKTALPATLGTGLKRNDGTALTTSIPRGAWWVSETRFLFVMKCLTAGANQNKYFLFLCNYNGSAWTVGSNSTAFDNGNAVLDLGLYSGGQAEDCGTLHQRSVAVGPSKILIGEYNSNALRTPGGVNDAVHVYQSADSGATWSALLTFNTAGNQIRHCHGVRYDRYTAEWYMLFGDDPNSAFLRWDGSSSAPPANTPLTVAGFTGYPGWEVNHDAAGLECRSGDISIHPQTAYYMADDSELNTPETYAFHVSKSHPMQRIRSNNFARTNGRSPLISCEMPNGSAFWGTIMESSDLGAAPESWPGYDFFYTPDGVSFTRVARTRNNIAGPTTGTLCNMFVSTEGSIVISGQASAGAKLLPAASTNGEGSIVVTPVAWNGVLATLQGAA